MNVEDVRAWLGTDSGIVATPHSQRSDAQILVRLRDGLVDFPITDIINDVEETLETPVQTPGKNSNRNCRSPMPGGAGNSRSQTAQTLWC